MKTTRILGIALALLLPLVASAAMNEGVITYSGFLHKADATAETAPQTLVFTLYDAVTLGNVLWTQTVNSGPLDSAGWFSVVLGASPSAFPPDGFLSQTWLGIKVGAEAEMTPRTKIGAAPHALTVDYTGVSGCTAANQILQWSGTAWTCIATPAGGGGGGVTGVTATAPLASSGGTAPVISMGANPTFTGTVTATTFAGALSGNATTATTATTALSANGVAAAIITPSDLVGVVGATGQVPSKTATTDTWTWVTPLSAPAAACATGNVLTWSGSALTCVPDSNTAYTAGAGLTLSGTQFAPSFTVSGGRNGTGTGVARGDHSHAAVTTIPMSDFALWMGTGSLGAVTVGSAVTLPAWTFSVANTCILGTARIPPGTGGSASNPPVISLVATAATTITGGIQLANSGLVAGAALPTSHWGAPGSITTTLTGGLLTTVTNSGMALGGFSVTGSNPAVFAGPGDLFLVRVCGIPGMQLVSVMLIWN